EAELADEIVRAGGVHLAPHIPGDRLGRAGHGAAVRGDGIELGRPGMPVLPAHELRRVDEARVPFRIGAPRGAKGFGGAVGDEDEAPDAHLRQRRVALGLAPRRAIALEARYDLGHGIEPDDVHAAACGALARLRRVHAVPERRMRLPPRPEGGPPAAPPAAPLPPPPPPRAP